MKIKIQPQSVTGGWQSAISRLGYKVLTRPGDFGYLHCILQKGAAKISFTQAPARILFADINDGDALVAMGKAGLITN